MLSSMESWTSRAAHRQERIKQRISATLSSMESWTSRAAHRQGRITTNFSHAVSHGVLDQQSGTQAEAYQTTNFSYAVFHGVLDQQSGTQAGTYHNEFQLRCLPWSLGPAERHTGRDVSTNPTNFSHAVSHGVLDQQSGTQAETYHNEFQLRCLPWSLGPAERHTGRDVSQRISATLSSMESWTSRAAHRQKRIKQRISATLSPMESWTSRAAHRQGRITTNFSHAVSHGVLDQQSGTQAGIHNNFSYAVFHESWTSRAAHRQGRIRISATLSPWSLGPAERHTGRNVSQRISATLSPMSLGRHSSVHNFNAVFYGVLDQQSGTQAGTYQQRISATLSSMESWTSRAAHRQKRIKQRISAMLSHGVLDQQSDTQAGTYHNEFQLRCLPWSLGPAERHTGRSVSNNEFQLRCLPWSLGPAERHTGRDVSQRISAMLSPMESWTSRAAHWKECLTMQESANDQYSESLSTIKCIHTGFHYVKNCSLWLSKVMYATKKNWQPSVSEMVFKGVKRPDDTEEVQN
ncbi:hypothetical protein J6590_086260 [Homalodisca vitripennis]|nr:hypothetical protein J6590_086260 [Homalodisca vitripennis]